MWFWVIVVALVLAVVGLAVYTYPWKGRRP
jgi:hypothetical protein